jgi:hypothetical protein
MQKPIAVESALHDSGLNFIVGSMILDPVHVESPIFQLRFDTETNPTENAGSRSSPPCCMRIINQHHQFSLEIMFVTHLQIMELQTTVAEQQ